MWIYVEKDLGGGNWEGTLKNTAFCLRSVFHGDVIQFHEDHIIDVYDFEKNPYYDETTEPGYVVKAREKQWYPDSFVYKHSNLKLLENQCLITVYTDDKDTGAVFEELIVEEVGERVYTIKCIPFYIEKLMYGDTITFEPESYHEYSIQESDYVGLFIASKEERLVNLKSLACNSFIDQKRGSVLDMSFNVKDWFMQEKLFAKIVKHNYTAELAGSKKLSMFLHENVSNSKLSTSNLPVEKSLFTSVFAYKHKNNVHYTNCSKICVLSNVFTDYFATEEILVEKLGNRSYRIKCIPTVVEQLCLEDVITFHSDSLTDYTVQKSNFICVELFIDDGNFEFLNEFSEVIIIEEVTASRKFIALNYVGSEKQDALMTKITCLGQNAYSIKDFDRLKFMQS
jgi:hypothetical protein